MERIKADFVTYHKIVEVIGAERIEERLCAIHDIYQEFLIEADLTDGVDVRLVSPQS